MKRLGRGRPAAPLTLGRGRGREGEERPKGCQGGRGWLCANLGAEVSLWESKPQGLEKRNLQTK